MYLKIIKIKKTSISRILINEIVEPTTIENGIVENNIKKKL
ncbi:hypothetical protein OAT35_00780 [Candidatus Pelagibacter sp.]|nr:hypothetical protein [Candidatus Pelagibacter sp.]